MAVSEGNPLPCKIIPGEAGTAMGLGTAMKLFPPTTLPHSGAVFCHSDESYTQKMPTQVGDSDADDTGDSTDFVSVSEAVSLSYDGSVWDSYDDGSAHGSPRVHLRRPLDAAGEYNGKCFPDGD